jgi:uncharacterized protein (TIGR00725 family)
LREIEEMKATASSKVHVAVVGPSEADERILDLAEEVGAEVARAGAVLLTGGMGGAMEAASRGAHREGGVTVGVLPGATRDRGNPYLDLSIPTGMGEMRNALLIRSADGVVAVGGGVGTLSEIALALKLGKPLSGLHTWRAEVGGTGNIVPVADSPREAVARVLSAVRAAAAR